MRHGHGLVEYGAVTGDQGQEFGGVGRGGGEGEWIAETGATGAGGEGWEEDGRKFECRERWAGEDLE